MKRLILEEDGTRRRFKLNPGTLTIGSSDACTLTLTSDDVAEIHAELEVGEDSVVLRPRPGVAAIRVGPRVVSSAATLQIGQKVKIGSATIWVEIDLAPIKSPPGSGRTPRASAATAAAARRTGVRSADSASGSARIKRNARRSPNQSFPTWLILLLAVPVIGLLFFFMKSVGESTGEASFSAKASQVRIEEAIRTGDIGSAEVELEIVRRQELSPDWQHIFDKYEKQVAADRAQGAEVSRNMIGNKYLESQLKKYINGYLKKNERPRARVFCRRADHFLATWPTHPERDWVRRMRDQFAVYAKLDEPPTLADAEWEAKTLVWAFPRDYKAAFKILEDFAATADGLDKEAALALIATHESEQQAYYDERLDLAAGLFEQSNKPKAAEYMVQLVMGIADPELENDAARRLTQMAGIEAAMAGIKRDRPEDFAKLKENAILRGFFEKKGL